MKLARQQNERTEAQQGIDQETRRVDPGKESGRNVVGLLGLIDQITNPAKQVKGRIKPNGEKGDQLDDRLGCDCKNEPIMVLGGVCVACAEQYCKQGEQDRDKKRGVDRCAFQPDHAGLDTHDHGVNGSRNRFQLQGDIGDGAKHGDHSRKGTHRGALSIA